MKINYLSSNTDKGRFTEDLAFQFLVKANYTILEMNWRCGHLETDLICQQGKELVFIEVKSRENDELGNPSASVSKTKKEKLIRAAYAYMEMKNYDGNFRFDIITIIGYHTQSLRINHYKDCFFPGL